MWKLLPSCSVWHLTEMDVCWPTVCVGMGKIKFKALSVLDSEWLVNDNNYFFIILHINRDEFRYYSDNTLMLE